MKDLLEITLKYQYGDKYEDRVIVTRAMTMKEIEQSRFNLPMFAFQASWERVCDAVGIKK